MATALMNTTPQPLGAPGVKPKPLVGQPGTAALGGGPGANPTLGMTGATGSGTAPIGGIPAVTPTTGQPAAQRFTGGMVNALATPTDMPAASSGTPTGAAKPLAAPVGMPAVTPTGVTAKKPFVPPRDLGDPATTGLGIPPSGIPPVTPATPTSGGAMPFGQPLTNDPITGNGQGGQPLTPTTPTTPTSTAAPLTNFGPGNDLTGTQINPDASARTQGTQGLVDTAAQGLSTSPDRTALALQTYQNLLDQTANQRKAGAQTIGRDAAKFGRIGAGMTTGQLGDLQSQLNQQETDARRGLSADTAGQQLADTTSKVNTLAGLEGQQNYQDTAAQNALRTERGYQYGVGQDAQSAAIQQKLLEDQLTNSALNRNVTQADVLSSLSGNYSNASAMDSNSIAALLQALAKSKQPATTGATG